MGFFDFLENRLQERRERKQAKREERYQIDLNILNNRADNLMAYFEGTAEQGENKIYIAYEDKYTDAIIKYIWQSGEWVMGNKYNILVTEIEIKGLTGGEIPYIEVTFKYEKIQ